MNETFFTIGIFSSDPVRVQSIRDLTMLEKSWKCHSLFGQVIESTGECSVYLVDLLADRATLLKALLGLSKRGENQKVLLMASEALTDDAQRLIKSFDLAGYLMRDALETHLVSRLQAYQKDRSSFRKHRRMNVSFPVRFEVATLIRDEGLCTSFGEGGMFVQTAKGPPKNAPVKITFQMPQTKKLSVLNGKTLWKSPAGFAILFKEPLPQLFESFEKNQPMSSL